MKKPSPKVPPPAGEKPPPKKKNKRARTGCVKAACVACYAAKAKCTDSRPCRRCTARCLECVTRQQHKRGRKTLAESGGKRSAASKSKRSASSGKAAMKSLLSSAFPDLALLADAANFSCATNLPPCPFAILLALLNDEGSARIQKRLLQPAAILAHHICAAMGTEEEDAGVVSAGRGGVGAEGAASSGGGAASFQALDRATQGLDDLLASELLLETGLGREAGSRSGGGGRRRGPRSKKVKKAKKSGAAPKVPVRQPSPGTPRADIRPPTITSSGASAGVPFYSRSFIRLASEMGSHLRRSATFRSEVAILVKATPSTSTSNTGLKSAANRAALLASYCEYITLLGRHMTAFLACQGVDTMELLRRMKLVPESAKSSSSIVFNTTTMAPMPPRINILTAVAGSSSSSSSSSAGEGGIDRSVSAALARAMPLSAATAMASMRGHGMGHNAVTATAEATAAALSLAAFPGAAANAGGSGKKGVETERAHRKKSGLPPCVVLCNMVKGVKRYGAKVKTPGRKTQMRIGSTFADPQSALTAALVFKRTAIADPETGIVSLDPMKCQLEQDKVCFVFRNRSMDVAKVSAIQVLLEVLKKKRHRMSSISAKSGGASSSSAAPGLPPLDDAGRRLSAEAIASSPSGAGSTSSSSSSASAAGAPAVEKAMAIEVPPTPATFIMQLPPSVVCMSLLCFLVEMNEIERGKRIQLIGPLWLCIPSDSQSSSAGGGASARMSSAMGVGVGLGRAASFVGAAGIGATANGAGEVFSAAAEIVAAQMHDTAAAASASAAAKQQPEPTQEIRPIMLRSSGGSSSLRPGAAHMLASAMMTNRVKAEKPRQQHGALGTAPQQIAARSYSAIDAGAGAAVDMRSRPLQVLALAESRSTSFSLSSELHPITPQQLYPRTAIQGGVVSVASAVAQQQWWLRQQQQQQQQQVQQQQQNANAELNPIPLRALSGSSRINASSMWNLSGDHGARSAGSMMGGGGGSLDYGRVFAGIGGGSQAWGIMGGAGGSPTAAAAAAGYSAHSRVFVPNAASGGNQRTRHPSAGYASTAPAAVHRLQQQQQQQFQQSSSQIHQFAGPSKMNAAAAAVAAAADGRSAPARPGLSGLFLRDSARSDSLCELFSACSGLTGPLIASMLHSLDTALIIDHVANTTFDIQLRVITSWSKVSLSLSLSLCVCVCLHTLVALRCSHTRYFLSLVSPTHTDMHCDVLAQPCGEQVAVAWFPRPDSPHANSRSACELAKNVPKPCSIFTHACFLVPPLASAALSSSQIETDVVLIEAVNSALSTKLQCELRLLADGNTLAVRYVALRMQSSAAGDDPDGSTWAVVARAARYYVRQEVTPLCFGLDSAERGDGNFIGKKPSWVY